MARKLSHSQNFIRSSALIDELLALKDVEIYSTDHVIDIGSGKGIIADRILKRLSYKGRLDLIEADRMYYEQLIMRFGRYQNVHITHANFLDISLPKTPFKIFSNIPFNFTSDILNKVLAYKTSLDTAYIIMQKEALENWGGSQVDERYGGSLKSLLNYPFYKVSEIYQFKQSDFSPIPSVQCVLAKFQTREKPLIDPENIMIYRDFSTAISNVRVGEAVWKKLFTKDQLGYMYKNYSLVPNSGLKAQNLESIFKTFCSFLEHTNDSGKRSILGSYDHRTEDVSKLEKVHRTR